ncbi:acetaldehyde dehydrogenase (acetylating), partial [Rhodococcus hoagii]|nr:acetaldehyde dehydrogenase (acetylating) [Prescottella equi]
VGGAKRGKAIIILNPAEPPLIMRDTVFCLVDAAGPGHPRPDPRVGREDGRRRRRLRSGYRLKQQVQIAEIPADQPVETLIDGGNRPTHQVSIFLEVEGAGHYLPAYAGNLDIMTSAGLQIAERIAQKKEATR